ncbi:MAG: hypothetical protein H6810_04175 [Phycisphaeraceae bacterium]|nr:MAG: hypothetical protein H6810_04175 [Phycisphaeraceae bacterium]
MKALFLAIVLGLLPAAARAADADTHRLARQTAQRAIDYLRSTQDASGGWAVNPDGPGFPAITALAVEGMLLDPRIDGNDPAVRAGVAHVLSFAQPDGSIHDGVLQTYNTAICVSMLSQVRTPEAASAAQRGIGVLRRMQWGAFDPSETPNPEAPGWTEPIDESHPFYGGLGYGRHGRPDASNTQFFVQALHDAGVSTADPAYQRALVFLRRVQMDERVNEMPYARGDRQGGFIYATVPDAESVDSIPGHSEAGTFEETLGDGTKVTRLRAYGSMTYAGFKSLLYADLPPDDPRVTAAVTWIAKNFSVSENPGLGEQGLYYQYAAMARALDAWGGDRLAGRDWRAELVHAIADLQEADGGMRSVNDRWMENNRDLITAYALVALGNAAR